MAYKLLTSGAIPISLDLVKAHAFLLDCDDDLLNMYLRAACERFTAATGFVIAESEFLYTADNFKNLRFHRTPVIEILEVKYIDVHGQEQTLENAGILFSDERPARIVHIDRFPETNNKPGSVQIKFKAGHNSENALPDMVRWGILTTVAHMYENREEVTEGTMSHVPSTVQMVINMYESKEVL